MVDFQMWLWGTLATTPVIPPFMQTSWGWPTTESLHFLGLCLLVGAIGVFDLRLLGLAPRIPPWALHRLVPWGVAGFVLNAVTGSMFLVTEPSQYIFNRAFHFKLLFLCAAGLNVAAFYTWSSADLERSGAGKPTTRKMKVAGALSLALWLGVIVAGRLLTFHRPSGCGDQRPFLAACLPGR